MSLRPSSSFLAALSLFFFERPVPGAYVLVDDLNNVFIVLTTFVGFTTSVFSASYIEHELETGRLTPTFLRFYHAMYQVLMFAPQSRAAHQQHRPDVGGDRAGHADDGADGRHLPHATSLEAAWKYFILCGVGIALALFGTILLYFAAAAGRGRRAERHAVDDADRARPALEPALLNLAFVFLLVGYGTKVGLVPLHDWLPDAHAEGPTPISAVLSGLLLNVALYAVVRCKVLLAAQSEALAPGPLMIGIGLVSVVFAAFML